VTARAVAGTRHVPLSMRCVTGWSRSTCSGDSMGMKSVFSAGCIHVRACPWCVPTAMCRPSNARLATDAALVPLCGVPSSATCPPALGVSEHLEAVMRNPRAEAQSRSKIGSLSSIGVGETTPSRPVATLEPWRNPSLGCAPAREHTTQGKPGPAPQPCIQTNSHPLPPLRGSPTWMVWSCTHLPTSHSVSVAKVAESATTSSRPCSTACVMRSRDPGGGVYSNLHHAGSWSNGCGREREGWYQQRTRGHTLEWLVAAWRMREASDRVAEVTCGPPGDPPRAERQGDLRGGRHVRCLPAAHHAREAHGHHARWQRRTHRQRVDRGVRVLQRRPASLHGEPRG
jgi:hypothetical protein